jgi:hypothetical protein
MMTLETSAHVIAKTWRQFKNRYTKKKSCIRYGRQIDIYISKDENVRMEVIKNDKKLSRLQNSKHKSKWHIHKTIIWKTVTEQETINDDLCRLKNTYGNIIEEIYNIQSKNTIIVRTIQYNRKGDVCCIINQIENLQNDLNVITEEIYFKNYEIIKHRTQ